jgi:hypothetical protein
MCSMTALGSSADRKNSSTVELPSLCLTCRRVLMCHCQRCIASECGLTKAVQQTVPEGVLL